MHKSLHLFACFVSVVCVYGGDARVMTSIWRSEHNLGESVLSFSQVGPGYKTLAFRMGGKCPYPPNYALIPE